MTKIPSHLKLHIIFWGIFFLYEVGVVFFYSGRISSFADYAVHYSLNIALFYVNAHLVFDRFLTDSKKSYILLVLFILLEFVVYTAVKYGMVKILMHFNIFLMKPYVSSTLFITESVWRAVYFVGLSTAYWFGLSVLRHQKTIAEFKNRELQTQLEKQVLENAYLQSQINPHFLFNTLTFLYTSANRFSEKLSESILLLSDLMRYSLKGPGEDGKTSLEEEIEHIDNLIQLNQARYDNRLQLDFKVEGNPDNLRIIPLALLTFVENVFKYADLKDENDRAKIYLHIHGKELIVNMSNKIKASGFGHSHGIGMENIKKRFDLYYKNRYILNIDSKENHYHLNLAITL